MAIHSALPEALTRAVDLVLRAGGARHVAHGDADPFAAAEGAAADRAALALIGPFRSADVAAAMEVTVPAGLPVLAPVATWAGVTRDDEPHGDDEPARHGGTLLRMVARDTVVAERLADHVRDAEYLALVVAGEHPYGEQLDAQLRLVGLPRAEGPGEADLVVLAGLAGEPEVALAADLAPLPVIAFDGVQDGDLLRGQALALALPFAPGELPAMTAPAERAARLVVRALERGAVDRPSLLRTLRELGRFDEHGDPVDPPVWLWRVERDWALEPDRPL